MNSKRPFSSWTGRVARLDADGPHTRPRPGNFSRRRHERRSRLTVCAPSVPPLVPGCGGHVRGAAAGGRTAVDAGATVTGGRASGRTDGRTVAVRGDDDTERPASVAANTTRGGRTPRVCAAAAAADTRAPRPPFVGSRARWPAAAGTVFGASPRKSPSFSKPRRARSVSRFENTDDPTAGPGPTAIITQWCPQRSKSVCATSAVLRTSVFDRRGFLPFVRHVMFRGLMNRPKAVFDNRRARRVRNRKKTLRPKPIIGR